MLEHNTERVTPRASLTWAEEWHMVPRTSFRSVLWSWISATRIFYGDISISVAARKAYRLDVTVVATVGGKDDKEFEAWRLIMEDFEV
ncbi:hypothetical protein RYX36_007457 [Vicia faba]